VQRGLRGYVLTGQPDALQPYRTGISAIPRNLDALAALAREDAVQQDLVQPLADDLAGAIAYARRLIAVRDGPGLEAAIALESTGAGRTIVDRVVRDLQAFTIDVHRLVLERDTEGHCCLATRTSR
jgi:CHASE3 domain sensor protein